MFAGCWENACQQCFLSDRSRSFLLLDISEKKPERYIYLLQLRVRFRKYILLGIKCKKHHHSFLVRLWWCQPSNWNHRGSNILWIFVSVLSKAYFPVTVHSHHSHSPTPERHLYLWVCDRSWSPGVDIPPPGLWRDMYKYLSEAFYHLAIKKWKVFYCVQD